MATYSILEIKAHIEESIQKKRLPYEQSKVNQQIFREHEVGYEAVLTGRGNEKVLIPEDGTVVYLFRGQNKEFKPCLPSLYRHDPKPLTAAEKFVWRMRLTLFRDMLDTYPIVEKFFKRHNFRVNYEGLAQHYGLLTSTLDLTSNLDIALFFATCWYDKESDCYRPFDDDIEHEGILYVFPMLATDTLSCGLDDYMNKNIIPIGLQPFPRSGCQKGYALHIDEGNSTKSWTYRFRFTKEDSWNYYKMFNEGHDLWINDILAEKTKEIARVEQFSFSVFNRTYNAYPPKGYSKTRLKQKLASIGIALSQKALSVTFSDSEKSEAIEKWNAGGGQQFCDMIGRRPWHLGIEPGNPALGKNARYTKDPTSHYRTMKMFAEMNMLRITQDAEVLTGAEWTSYIDNPAAHHVYRESQCQKVPARLINAFSQRYLRKEDYLI